MLSELLYANDLVSMRKTIMELSSEFRKCKMSFESLGFRVSFRITNVIVSGGITKDDLSYFMIYLCVVLCLRVRSRFVLRV